MVKATKGVKTSKTVAKKKTATEKKPTAAKKPVAAKKAVKKVTKKVTKKTALKKTDYVAKIKGKKQEAHDKNWLYIEVNANDLNQELEELENLDEVCEAMADSLLEGDDILVDTEGPDGDFTVRYYVDNLSPDRKKFNW